MAMYLVRTLFDGATVVADDGDGVEFVLRPGDWERIQRLPTEQRRGAAERLVLAHRADPSGGRTPAEQDAMEQASQGQGERHQDQGEAT